MFSTLDRSLSNTIPSVVLVTLETKPVQDRLKFWGGKSVISSYTLTD